VCVYLMYTEGRYFQEQWLSREKCSPAHAAAREGLGVVYALRTGYTAGKQSEYHEGEEDLLNFTTLVTAVEAPTI
jgi:hypothetical protein